MPPSVLPPVDDVGEEPRGFFRRRRARAAEAEGEIDLTRERAIIEERERRYAEAAQIAAERRRPESGAEDDEAARRTDEALRVEEARREEARRRADMERRAEAERRAADERRAEAERQSDAERAAEERRRAAASRLADEARRQQAEADRREAEERAETDRREAEERAHAERREADARAEAERQEAERREADERRAAERERREADERRERESARAEEQQREEQRRISALDIARAEEARRAEDARRALERERATQEDEPQQRRRLFRHTPEPVAAEPEPEPVGTMSSVDTGIVMNEVAAYRDELERLRRQIAALSDDLAGLDVPETAAPDDPPMAVDEPVATHEVEASGDNAPPVEAAVAEPVIDEPVIDEPAAAEKHESRADETETAATEMADEADEADDVPAAVETERDERPAPRQDDSGFEPARVWRPGGGFSGAAAASEPEPNAAEDGEPEVTATEPPRRPGADLARRLAEANARREELERARGDSAPPEYDEPDRPKAPIRRAFRRLFEPGTESESGSGTEEGDQGGREQSIKEWLDTGDIPPVVEPEAEAAPEVEAEPEADAAPEVEAAPEVTPGPAAAPAPEPSGLPPGTDLARRLARVSAEPPPGEADLPFDGPRPNVVRRLVGWLFEPADHEPADHKPDDDSDGDRGVTAAAEDDHQVDVTDEAAAPTVVTPAPPAAKPSVTPPVTQTEDKPQPGVDLVKRLAAANAAALARAQIKTPLEDRPVADEPAEDDPGLLRRRGADTKTSDRNATTISRTETRPRAESRASTASPDRPTGGSVLRTARDNTWVRLLIAVVAIVIAAVLLRTYVVSPYYIPSASMETTLHGCPGCNNDHVLVNKLSYSLHPIHRGDVVVFNRPASWQVGDKVLIKRVIGLPGDVISATGGSVYVNGDQLGEPYVDPDCTKGTSSFKAITVPAGDIFVMGDNRCDSSDSRTFGAFPKSKVIGRAFLIIWPLGRIHWL